MPGMARQLQGALDEQGVVVLSQLNISDDDLDALARLLGEVVLPPYGARDLPQHRPAPPSHAVFGDVATVDAPGDDRR